jgi:hypothetical protein
VWTLDALCRDRHNASYSDLAVMPIRLGWHTCYGWS